MSSPPPSNLPAPWPPSGTVIPFPLPWGQTGCCPPGGMDALMKCYCDIQAASAFIGQIMIDQINNNPAVTEAIIAAIQKSGSNLPLIGVTDGSNAQPGQVGEFIELQYNFPFTNGTTTGPATAGIIQPGDWDIWVIASPNAAVEGFSFTQSPLPTGMTAQVAGFFILTGGTAVEIDLMSTLGRGTFSVPTLMTFNVSVTATAAGTMFFDLFARRMR